MSSVSTSFLSNIHPKIQKELFRKMDLDGKIRGEQGSQDVRACWAKMTSGVGGTDEKVEPIILMGGELYEGQLKGGFDANYNWSTSGLTKNFGESISDSNGEVYRPMAGLTGIESQTDGSYGSLKKATVSWQCWSMNDLGRLGKAFMTPGRSVMLEWGWSTKPGDILTYGPDEMNLAIKEGKRRILENGGNYELLSGVVKNFSWSANADGGFDCQTDIISHGTPMVEGGMGSDSNIQVPEGGTTSGEEALAALTALGFNNMQKYLNNIKLEIIRHLNPNTTIDDPWLGRDNVPGATNFTRKNTEIRDSKLQFGSVTFISWGYFEDNILSKYLGRISKSGDVKYSFRSIDAIEDAQGNISYKSVRCSNHRNLQTADSRICQFPGQGGTKGDFENFSVPGTNQRQGYLRNIKLNVEFIKTCWLEADTLQAGMDKMFKGINDITGNIFDFRLMADDCQTSNLRVVDMNVQENSVQDLLKNRSEPTDAQPTGLFYFPYMTAANTLVRTQNLTAKLPNSSMYAAMYGSNKVKIDDSEPVRIDDATVEALSEQLRDGEITDKFLGGFGVPDAQTGGGLYGNRDGSLPKDPSDNRIDVAKDLNFDKGPPMVEGATLEGTMEVMSNKQKEAEAAEKKEEDKAWYEVAWDYTGGAVIKGATWLVEKVAEGAEYLYRAGYAALSEYDQGEIMTSWQIAQMIEKIQYSGDDPIIHSTDFMLPLELSLTIDGCGGIFPGNAFSSDYLPADYQPHPYDMSLSEFGAIDQRHSDEFIKTHTQMKGAVFMCKSIKHSVSADGWTTDFEGIMRASIPPPPKKKKKK